MLSKLKTRTPYGKVYKEEMRPTAREELELEEELKKQRCIIKYVEDDHFRREIEDIFAHVKDFTNFCQADNGRMCFDRSRIV